MKKSFAARYYRATLRNNHLAASGRLYLLIFCYGPRVKTFLNALLLLRAAKANKTGLVAAAIALNGGWRAAGGALVLAFIMRVSAVLLPLLIGGIVYLIK